MNCRIYNNTTELKIRCQGDHKLCLIPLEVYFYSIVCIVGYNNITELKIRCQGDHKLRLIPLEVYFYSIACIVGYNNITEVLVSRGS